ncbi:uncharacterized protein LOC108158726 isoform X6 [Drosophila miranda]|uniref:uncharacterized protein LOC108158726 isoform X6 n=1 Tax=Drosophila miranda TaxID=7229 RepID=UPI00143F19A0|nr:uncharacterized protein LOC108158726 isoform X6 [Drosophila miranda]
MENVSDASCSASSLKLQRQQTQIKAKNVLIRSQSSGKLSRNEAESTTTATAKTTKATTRTLKVGAMQQKKLQSPNGVNASNIILLRGTRNENGQIIIQNKQDILTLLNEQQQHQEKAAQASTAITLNQLPTTTTVARETIVQSSGSSTTSTSSTISIVASSGSRSSGVGGKDAVSNTILLQTPINASQLESVLKAQERTKQANGTAQTKLIERPFLLKHATRSLSSECNCDSKSPFVLQTLKRLEKSQSILVIRNSTSGSTSSMAVSPPVNVSASVSSNVLSVTRTSKAAKGMAGALHKLKAAATAAAAAGAGAGAAPSASSTGTNILRLGKSATTLAINGAGGSSKLEAAAASATTTSTANKLSNAVTSEQQQQQSTTTQTNVPLGNDGEPIKLPDNLESLPRADSFSSQRHRWNTNEEIAAILISFDKHCEWQSKKVRTRPKSGSLLLYSRKKVRYRRDGYCWKKRKDGKTTREDHMKLKVQGTECIYGCYVHSAILPTFHRRCYWLLQNPDIVLVHYLNVPYPDDNKMAVIAPSITLWGDKKEWTKEELVSQLKPMLSTVNSDDDSDSGNYIEISTAETVESIVCQLMEKQCLSRQAALVKQLDCGCGDSGCADGKTCTHPVMRRTGGIIKSAVATSASEKRLNEGAFNSGTPNVVVASKLYSRWAERPRQRNDGMHLENPHAQFHNATQQLPQESAIKFQIIPPQQKQQQQQQQQTGHGDGSYQQQYRGANQMLAARNNLVMQQQQQYHQQQQQHLSLQRFVASHCQNSAHLNQHHHGLQIANTTITATARDPSTTVAAAATATAASVASASAAAAGRGSVLNGMDTELIEIQSHMTANKITSSVSSNGNDSGSNSSASASAKQFAAQTNNELNVVNNNDPSNNNFMYNQQQQQLNTSSNSTQQQQQQHYYKLQQTSATPNSGQLQNQTQTPTLLQPPVEAMCMSPEHRSGSSSSSNNNTASTSSAVNSDNTSPSTAIATTTSMAASISIYTSTSGTSSTSSSLQSIIDGNQQQQITTTSTAATCDNLMSANALTELNGGSSSSSSNNQATDGHNKSQSQSQSQPQTLSQNGCATFSASSDNSSQISASDESSSFGDNNQNNSIHSIHSSHSSSSNSSEDEPQAGNAAETLSFFNETLDLSDEDIQRTLIANMQPYNTAAGEAATTTIEPLATNGSHSSSNSNGNPQEVEKKPSVGQEGEAEPEEDDTDDVFANLDAFDMLVEFPELDLDVKQALNNTALEQGSYLGQAAAQTQQPRKIHNICDFSPEWSYTEGGVKVLVAGPWTSSNGAGAYTVLFDAQPVPTQMVQEGVLRCYCPAHGAGFVTLQVACGGFLVSNSVLFEYKLSLLADAPFDASSSNDCLYKFTLLNRLSTIDDKLQLKTEQEPTTDHTALYLEPNFEEKLVAYCHRLTKHAWSMPSTVASWSVGLRGMTLLHLAAALGYAKLVGAMLNWRAENPHIILETELDAISQDVYGFTPLAWSCVRGHVECSLLLYKWNHNALKIKTQGQQTALDLANLKGHKHLLAQIFRLEKERCRKPHLRGGLANLSMNLGVETEAEESQPQTYNSFDLEILQRKHDVVFLRPGAVHSNQSPPNNGSKYSKRSSIDSGINMDIRSKSGKSLARLHSNFEGHDSYALGVDSPLDTLTGTNCLLSPLRKMDFALWDSDAKVVTLAEHIIAAMPERIKNEADEMMVLSSPLTEPLTSESSALTDSFMDPLLDSLPNTHFDSDFNFDFHDHSYRYHDVSTPCSSLSPASSGPLQSPASYSILGTDPSVSSPSPPPSTKQLTEFLHASSLSQYPFESDFSKLTLTDTEQRELYEAAKCIQKAYRSYKGRQKLEEQNKERTAAIVIQNYYRRYKQYAYYRQMTNAALVIQHGYRSYRKNKRFKKSGLGQGMAGGSDHGSVSSNSQCLSSFYDHYKQDQQQLQQQHEMGSQPRTPKETSPSGPLKRTYSQSTQNQAARKIQQFMRLSRINIWDANLTTLTTEGAGRKREAGAPTQGGIPSKLAVSRAAGNLGLPRK